MLLKAKVPWTPVVDGGGALAHAEDQLGRAVPRVDHHVLRHGRAEVQREVVFIDARQAEVADLDFAVLGDEQVGRLQVA